MVYECLWLFYAHYLFYLLKGGDPISANKSALRGFVCSDFPLSLNMRSNPCVFAICSFGGSLNRCHPRCSEPSEPWTPPSTGEEKMNLESGRRIDQFRVDVRNLYGNGENKILRSNKLTIAIWRSKFSDNDGVICWIFSSGSSSWLARGIPFYSPKVI